MSAERGRSLVEPLLSFVRELAKGPCRVVAAGYGTTCAPNHPCWECRARQVIAAWEKRAPLEDNQALREAILPTIWASLPVERRGGTASHAATEVLRIVEAHLFGDRASPAPGERPLPWRKLCAYCNGEVPAGWDGKYCSGRCAYEDPANLRTPTKETGR